MFEYAIKVLESKLKELDREKKPFKELREELRAAIELLTEKGKILSELEIALGRKK